MSEWKEVELKEFGRVVTGKTPPTEDRRYFDGEFQFVSPKDLEFDSRYIYKTLTTITQKAISKFKNQILDKNSIMFTSLSYGFGKIGIVENIALTNQQINSIIVNPEMYDYNFIYYLLRFSKDRILSYNAGIVTPIIPKSLFEKIKFNVPTLPTQKRIASILSAYDDLIENNLKRIKLLEEIAQRTYEEWFVKFRINGVQLELGENGLPEGWERKKLVEVAEITMGQSPKSEFYNKEEKGLPFHQGVSDYGFRFPSNSTWSSEGTRFAQKNSILFSVRAPVGRLNIAIEKIILGRGLSAIKHKNNFTSTLFYQLQKIFFKDDLMGGGAIFNSVTKSDVERIEVIEAENNIMLQFESKAKSIDNQIENLTNQNRLLRESRDILLPRLMSGKLGV
jgi:type I restriction enzyme S subunit